MAVLEEKRRHNRFNFQKTVKVFPVLPSKSGNIYEVQNQSLEVKAFDISEGGLRLESEGELNPNFLIKMNFELIKDRPVEVFGRIMWSSERSHGIRFMVADHEIQHGVRALSKKKA